MALINSSDEQKTISLEDDAHAIRLLQGLMADESGAASLYSKIIDSLKGKVINNEIIDRLEEIRIDELHHLGSLMYCISLLSPETVLEYDKGFDGNED